MRLVFLMMSKTVQLFHKGRNHFYIFFLLFFPLQIQRAEHEPLNYGNFKTFLNHVLNVSHAVETINVKDYFECALGCIINMACFSFNIAILPDINSNHHACHLLATDKYNQSQSFVSSHDFHHHTVTVNRLDRSPSNITVVMVILVDYFERANANVNAPVSQKVYLWLKKSLFRILATH